MAEIHPKMIILGDPPLFGWLKSNPQQMERLEVKDLTLLLFSRG